jgi:hypothetical protein
LPDDRAAASLADIAGMLPESALVMTAVALAGWNVELVQVEAAALRYLLPALSPSKSGRRRLVNKKI